jgi:hypothetical protein
MHHLTRQQTNVLIRKGLIRKKLRCEKCGGLKPVVNHLDYSHPDKVNFLCYRCHMLYHEYRNDGVPGSLTAFPEWLFTAYRRFRRVKAFWLYSFWLPVRYFHRRFWPLPERIEVVEHRRSIFDQL